MNIGYIYKFSRSVKVLSEKKFVLSLKSGIES